MRWLGVDGESRDVPFGSHGLSDYRKECSLLAYLLLFTHLAWPLAPPTPAQSATAPWG